MQLCRLVFLLIPLVLFFSSGTILLSYSFTVRSNSAILCIAPDFSPAIWLIRLSRFSFSFLYLCIRSSENKAVATAKPAAASEEIFFAFLNILLLTYLSGRPWVSGGAGSCLCVLGSFVSSYKSLLTFSAIGTLLVAL